ncbi:ClpP/crotonase-like domain-containing protein [Xylogone sp. PMI_703]|nr:ClpP/crotonase-like domain-containing protein [Xylogone sp. PMI_703]
MPFVATPWTFDNVIELKKISPAYWIATFNAPPLNVFTPRTYQALRELIDLLEHDKQVKVIVFDSAAKDYFISHFDLSIGPADWVVDEPGTEVIVDWANFIRGRIRGHGSKFVLACYIRFASREKAILAQPEVGAGVTCGGGGIEWLPRLTNRSRALEILLGSEDIDAPTAELYGYINRAIADDKLDAHVDNFARRVAGFDHQPLMETKRSVNDRIGLPSDADFLASMQIFVWSCSWPRTQQNLGHHLHRTSVKLGFAEK